MYFSIYQCSLLPNIYTDWSVRELAKLLNNICSMVPMPKKIRSKFEGKDSEISLGGWKTNLQMAFALQGVPIEFRAELIICCLEGEAKRDILILPLEKRSTAKQLFNELGKLDGDRATALVLRSQFFNARQEAQEDIGSFALRLKKHFLRLKKMQEVF